MKPTSISTLLTSVQRASSKISPKVLTALSAASIVYTAFDTIRESSDAISKRAGYSFTVSDRDPIFPFLSEFLQQNARAQRHVRVSTKLAPNGSPEGQDGTVHYLLDDDVVSYQRINGHPAKVESFTQGKPAAGRSFNALYPALNNNNITITVYTKPAVKMLKELFEQFLLASEAATAKIYIADRYGDWGQTKRAPTRDISTVVLPDGITEKLLGDVDTFLSSKDFYRKHGLPYHRGYLFSGPPGTGKTSLSEALAVHIGYSLAYLPLSTVEDDATLNELLAALPARTVLVIEDVDTLSSTRTRKEDQDDPIKGVTLGGLLNNLDGMLTPEGMIVVMTTNHPDRLDPALTRPGRVDFRVEMSYLTQEQLENLFHTFTSTPLPADIKVGDKKIVASEVMDYFKRNLNEPSSFAEALRQKLS